MDLDFLKTVKVLDRIEMKNIAGEIKSIAASECVAINCSAGCMETVYDNHGNTTSNCSGCCIT